VCLCEKNTFLDVESPKRAQRRRHSAPASPSWIALAVERCSSFRSEGSTVDSNAAPTTTALVSGAGDPDEGGSQRRPHCALCTEPPCRHYLEGQCTASRCKFHPCCHRKKRKPTNMRHVWKHPRVYCQRILAWWSRPEFIAAFAYAKGQSQQEVVASLTNLTRMQAFVIMEALAMHCGSEELAVCTLRRLAEEVPSRALLEVLAEAQASWRPIVQLDQWTVEYFAWLTRQKQIAPHKAQFPDLWYHCGWSWPEKGDLPRVPWNGFCNQLLWRVALVRWRLCIQEGLQPELNESGRGREYFERIMQASDSLPRELVPQPQPWEPPRALPQTQQHQRQRCRKAAGGNHEQQPALPVPQVPQGVRWVAAWGVPFAYVPIAQGMALPCVCHQLQA